MSCYRQRESSESCYILLLKELLYTCSDSCDSSDSSDH
jgi:hypothetical protein